MSNNASGETNQECSFAEADFDELFARRRSQCFTDIPVTENEINTLANGIQTLYQTDINKIENRLGEITRNQGILMDITQNEVIQLQECIMLNEINETFEKVKLYQKKLQGMKKNMTSLTDRINKTKNAALKLQIQKQKEELHMAQEQEKQRKYENALTAKPAQSVLSTTE